MQLPNILHVYVKPTCLVQIEQSFSHVIMMQTSEMQSIDKP